MPLIFPSRDRRARVSSSPSRAADEPSPFDGLWASEVEREVGVESLGVIRIAGTKAFFRNGAVLILTRVSPSVCTLVAPVGSGRAHRGVLRSDGKLAWCDGDVWAREPVARSDPATKGRALVDGRGPGSRAINGGDGPFSLQAPAQTASLVVGGGIAWRSWRCFDSACEVVDDFVPSSGAVAEMIVEDVATERVSRCPWGA